MDIKELKSFEYSFPESKIVATKVEIEFDKITKIPKHFIINISYTWAIEYLHTYKTLSFNLEDKLVKAFIEGVTNIENNIVMEKPTDNYYKRVFYVIDTLKKVIRQYSHGGEDGKYALYTNFDEGNESVNENYVNSHCILDMDNVIWVTKEELIAIKELLIKFCL